MSSGKRIEGEPLPVASGVNDAFVAVAAGLALIGIGLSVEGWVEGGVAGDGILLAGTWGIAEISRRSGRRKLTEALLALLWTGGWIDLAGWRYTEEVAEGTDGLDPIAAWAMWAGVAGAIAWWTRFRTPISEALVVIGLWAAGVATWAVTDPGAVTGALREIAFASGMTCVAVGAWRDYEARKEGKGASDAAFWMHAAGAVLVAHPVFSWTGALEGRFEVTLAVYGAMALGALALNRRALVLAGLVYFVAAVGGALEPITGATGWDGWTQAGAVVGTTLLVVGLAWNKLQGGVNRGICWIYEKASKSKE